MTFQRLQALHLSQLRQAIDEHNRRFPREYFTITRVTRSRVHVIYTDRPRTRPPILAIFPTWPDVRWPSDPVVAFMPIRYVAQSNTDMIRAGHLFGWLTGE